MSDLPLLLVDGYNVISQDEGYRRAFDRDRHGARARLVEDVAAFSVGRYESVVVFDAKENPAADGAPHEIAGVTVVFSPAGTDADSVIESRALEARRRGRDVVVATSDAVTQWTVGLNVTRLSARGLIETMREHDEEWREHSGETERSRVEDRVDPRTRDALHRWARGE